MRCVLDAGAGVSGGALKREDVAALPRGFSR